MGQYTLNPLFKARRCYKVTMKCDKTGMLAAAAAFVGKMEADSIGNECKYR
jgi:hypothetical protein